MKDKTIKAMAERVGQTRAEKFWALFVERLCDGIEPEDGDTFKREDIEKRFESNPTARDAFIAVLCVEQKPEAPKGRKFKAEKARAYSAAEVVSFIAADPKVEGLRTEYMRRTGGEPALFYVDGKLCEAESADRIQRLFDRDPVAPFVIIAGREVTPVGYPDDAAKEDAEDPYQRGVALGQPGDVSARLEVSLAAIPHDTMQAIACAMENDLADASKRDLQRDAEAAKGKTPAEYLADKPIARRKWPTWPKPSLTLKRRPKAPTGPFVEPSAPTAPREGIQALPTGAHRIFVFGAQAAGEMWPALRTAMGQLRRQGVVVESDLDAPEGAHMPTWHASHVQGATMFLALLTSAFADSPELDEVEALQAAGRVVFPVSLRPLDLSYSSVGRLVSIPRDRPVSQYADKDAAYTQVAEGVKAVLATFAQRMRRPTYDRDSVFRAIVALGLDRDTLAMSLDPTLAAQLPKANSDGAQLLSDLNFLERLRNGGDKEPLRNYLATALMLSPQRRESAVFRTAIEAL